MIWCLQLMICARKSRANQGSWHAKHERKSRVLDAQISCRPSNGVVTARELVAGDTLRRTAVRARLRFNEGSCMRALITYVELVTSRRWSQARRRWLMVRRAVPEVVAAWREAVEDGRRERERVREAHRRHEQAEADGRGGPASRTQAMEVRRDKRERGMWAGMIDAAAAQRSVRRRGIEDGGSGKGHVTRSGEREMGKGGKRLGEAHGCARRAIRRKTLTTSAVSERSLERMHTGLCEGNWVSTQGRPPDPG